MIISLEVAIDSIRQYEKVSGRTDESLTSRIIFAALAGLMAFAMPMVFIGTQIAVGYGDPSPLPWPILSFIIVPLAILTAAGHILMLFSEMVGLESRSYLVFRMIRRGLNRKVRSLGRRAAAAERRLMDEFQLYCQQVENHNNLYDSNIKHGPFTNTAREILNGLFGNIIVPGDTNKSHSDPSPSAADDDDDDDETSEDHTDPIFSPTGAEWKPF